MKGDLLTKGFLAVLVLLLASTVPAAAEEPSEPGIPVTSKLVVSKCSMCHERDTAGNLSRISWLRTTPEGWQQAIKRMARLYQIPISPDDARAIVRYLSDNHGLAPEEARPAMYTVERRMVDEVIPDPSIRMACASCHAFGRALSWRRTKEEWQLLVNMHIGFFPVVDIQGFYGAPTLPGMEQAESDGDTIEPVDKAIAYLSEHQPLHTPEWSAWSASKRTPLLEGTWYISAKQPGKGRVYGEMVVEKSRGRGEYGTRTTLRYARSGRIEKRTGRVAIYTGYAWRGRSFSEGNGKDAPEQIREVMMVSKDQSRIEGRWFWGGYDEFGLDVTLIRGTGAPVLFGVHPESVFAGAEGVKVEIHGANFPPSLDADAVDLGPGVRVTRILSQNEHTLTVEADVSKDGVSGRRNVAVGHTVLPEAFAVYDAIDYLKVVPEAGMARLGGAVYPKGYQQFDAMAFQNGPDGDPGTEDDVALGTVDASWSLEEFYSTFGDDDMEFVGALDGNGLFTPAVEGPNPKRQYSRNNYGDVWVVATLESGLGVVTRNGEALRGRSHLIATVPLYIRWDQPELFK